MNGLVITMCIRQRRDQRMTGDAAPPIQRTEAERRALLERLERLRTLQEPRLEWLDRGTEGRRGTEPSQTPPPRRRASRHASPPQTRTDPTYTPPRQAISEGERREIIERASPPQSSGGVEWLPPATTGSSSGSLDERLQEQQREIEELQGQYARGTQDRGVQENIPRRLTRDQLGETRQPLLPPDHPLALPPNHPLRFQRRLREGTFIPDRSDIPFLLLPPRELGDRIADEIPRLEAELRRTPVLGNIAGIFLGVWRYFTNIAESLVALPGIIRELFQEIINLDRESLIEICLLLRDLALANPNDPEVMRPIAEAVWAPVLEIGEKFRLGVEAADHDQIESSARIIQATLGIIDLIATLEGVIQVIRRSPQHLTYLRRLANLRRSRRQLAVVLEHTRRRLQRSELGRFTLRLLEDEHREIGKRVARGTMREGEEVVTGKVVTDIPLGAIDATPRRGGTSLARQPTQLPRRASRVPQETPEALPRTSTTPESPPHTPPRPATTERPADPRSRGRALRDYDVGAHRLVRSRSNVLETVGRTPSLRPYQESIEQALQSSGWQEVQRRGRGLLNAFRGSAASRQGALNSLKGFLQEQIMRTLPWFSRTRTAALERLRRINAALPVERRFTETIHFSSNVSVGGRELSDGIFFARSNNGQRIIVLDIVEVKSRTNWTALYTGSRAQIRRDIQRFLNDAITIDGGTFRHSDGSLRFMSDYGQRQAWSLSVPRQITDSPSVISRLREGAGRVSSVMPSDFTVKFGALPDEEARLLAEVILEEFALLAR